MNLVKIDLLGLLDTLSGLLLYFTASPIPEVIAVAHAVFLIVKGVGTMVEPVKFPFGVFILGGFADLMSSSILFFGRPPMLVEYKLWISGILFLKGVWSMLGLVSLQS
ncbi:MAG: hypothetical protein ABEK00_03355 [Candidatus Nanohaloarchaea archaeon]